jgi:hypothetical protein
MQRSLVGRQFNGLLVLSTHGRHAAVRCHCGKEFTVWKANLYRNNTKSCGCTYRTAGGFSKKRVSEYDSWHAMIDRCTNLNNKQWSDYGGRGIRVCDAWSSFPQFLNDMGPKSPSARTIERIDNDGNYEPSNCRWATRDEQMRNTRKNKFITIGNRTETYSVWIREFDINPSTFYGRLRRGVSPQQAIIPPDQLETGI